MFAAAKPTDLIVLAVVAVGVLLALTGLASFDPRVRRKIPIGPLARGNALASVGLIIASLLLISLALGGAE
ncbi:MAG: hypothetical protein ACLGHT_07460 [Acidimicrobiia bacterium]